MQKRLEQDMKLLQYKWIIISDEKEVLWYLQKIGYHRLSVYTYNTNDFATIKSRYIFDKRLRTLVMDMLEVIENSIKSIIYYHLWDQFDSHIRYTEQNIYNQQYATQRLAKIQEITKQLSENDQLAKKYFRENPWEVYLPDYIFFDKLTFGELIYIFRDFDIEHQKVISGYYGLNYQVFDNRIVALRYFRNLCSHFEHIYNRTMVYAVKWYGIVDSIWNNNRFISYFLIISIFQKILIPNYTRSDKVIELLNKFSISTEEIWLQNKNLPSKLESEAWEVLIHEVYTKNIKNANLL